MRLRKITDGILVFAILITSQLACKTLSSISSAPQPPQTFATPTAPVNTETPMVVSTPTDTSIDISRFSDDEIMTGIQEAVDAYAAAYTNNDPNLLEQFIDQQNKPFRRIVRSRFDDFQSSYAGGKINFQYDVVSIQRREYGYVLAHIESPGSNLKDMDWLYRFNEDRWVLTEPTVEQVGKPVTTATEHFNFTMYHWSDDVNPQIVDMMENAYQQVKTVLGKAPEEKANVKILPIYGLTPFNPMMAIALYSSGQNDIEVYAPFSYAYGSYDPALGWDGELQGTLTHEFTHMTHQVVFGKAGKLADWMSEGLAEYVAGATDNKYYACTAFKSGTLIPILDESGAVYKQDLMHMYLLQQDFGLSYDFATSLVDFTVEKHGGLDGFWKLAHALDDTGDFKKAVQQAFGISYEQYNQEWQKWLKGLC
jgi:hypothetical protein